MTTGAATKLTLFNTVQATGKFNEVRTKDFLHALSIESFTPLQQGFIQKYF